MYRFTAEPGGGPRASVGACGGRRRSPQRARRHGVRHRDPRPGPLTPGSSLCSTLTLRMLTEDRRIEAPAGDLDARVARWRFVPHPGLANPHLQTIAGALWRRTPHPGLASAEPRY